VLRIYWVRHGEVINPGGDKFVHYGSLDVELSALGKEEAKVAGMYLQQFPLSNLYSSQLSRSIYGAEQVLQYQNSICQTLQLVKLKGFNELDRGEWTGKTTEEIGSENLQRFNECDETVTPTNGESYRTLYARVIHTRDNEVLKNMMLGTTAAVVSHVQVTRCMVVDALRIPIEQMESQVTIATASITCIDYVYNEAGIMSEQIVRFRSFKPAEVLGFQKSIDEAN
jgi:broad specificity phosphatase PhoE